MNITQVELIDQSKKTYHESMASNRSVQGLYQKTLTDKRAGPKIVEENSLTRVFLASDHPQNRKLLVRDDRELVAEQKKTDSNDKQEPVSSERRRQRTQSAER